MNGEVLSPASVQWVLGLLGTGGAVLMVLKIASSCKELFGRKPSMGEELDKREGLFRLELDQLRLQLDQHKTHVEQRFADLEIQRSRSLGVLHEKINTVSDAVARIEGMLEAKRKPL